MSRFLSILSILFFISTPASSWSPDAHIAHPSALSKDLSNVKRIWYLPDNPGEAGTPWGIQSRDQMKVMQEGPLAPQEQRATDNTECEDYYFDGMTGDAYCWSV
jgi:hypothetical protein